MISRGIRSGVGEIMKAAIIHDVRLYSHLQQHGPRLIAERRAVFTF